MQTNVESKADWCGGVPGVLAAFVKSVIAGVLVN